MSRWIWTGFNLASLACGRPIVLPCMESHGCFRSAYSDADLSSCGESDTSSFRGEVGEGVCSRDMGMATRICVDLVATSNYGALMAVSILMVGETTEIRDITLRTCVWRSMVHR